MAGTWILVPYNFTDYDEKALHYVIRTFADQKAVHVSLLHAYTPLPELDGYSHASLGRLKTTMASMWTEIREKEKELKRVREDLVANGFQVVLWRWLPCGAPSRSSPHLSAEGR